MNWKLTLAYDGTDFHGWQVQPALPTIQGELAAAIERVTRERVLPQGSGRTDTGVHARAQVASFELSAPIPPENLQRALNRTLPAAIRVLSVRHAAPEFHARHSVAAKTYEYRLWRGEICPPFAARYVYALNWPLQLKPMIQAAAIVTGEHDFTSFAASDPDLATRRTNSSDTTPDPDLPNPDFPDTDPLDPDTRAGNIRTIFSSEFLPAPAAEGEMLLYRVRGNGFLHHMVRNLVGTFLDVGRGHIPPDSIRHILNQRSRAAAGPTAPARGLLLDSVEY